MKDILTNYYKQLGLLIFLNIIDACSTYYAITTGIGVELNPVMAWLLDYNPVVFLFVKVSLVTFIAVPLLFLIRETKYYHYTIRGSLGLYIGIVIWHAVNYIYYFGLL